MSLALSYVAYNGASLTGWMLWNELPTCTPLSSARFLPPEHSYDSDSEVATPPAQVLVNCTGRVTLYNLTTTTPTGSTDVGTSPVLT